MTVKLAQYKATQILRLYFRGMTQADIAGKLTADQTTVSLYACRFKKKASQIGLLAAGKEFNVFNEVDGLRSLAVELFQAELTLEQAKQGLKIYRIFLKLGVSPDQHAALVKVCQEINDPGFIQATLKLSKIESESNTSYQELISRIEKAVSELPMLEKKLKETRAALDSASKSLSQKKAEVASSEAHLAQLKQKDKAQQVELEQNLAAKMKEAKVKLAEVEETAKLKAELAKSGLDIPTLIKLAKEFGDGDSKGK